MPEANIKHSALKRVCGHCGVNAKMIVKAEYDEQDLDFVDGRMIECGKLYEIFKCQSCDKIELAVHDYHEGMDNVEMFKTYKTLYPAPVSLPEGLPAKVKKEYQRALKARHGDSNGYGVLLGRVLEAVFHDKKAKGKMLGQQLKYLAEQNLLPKETLAFASKLNELRVVGAHFKKGELTPKDILIMERLIKSILEYVYTAPYIMNAAKKAVKNSSEDDNDSIPAIFGNMVTDLR